MANPFQCRAGCSYLGANARTEIRTVMHCLNIDLSAQDNSCPVDVVEPLTVATAPVPASVTHIMLSPAGIRTSSLMTATSGLGSSTSGAMLNLFCFVVQVSARLPAKCYRSDNRFLLLLPCLLGIDMCSFKSFLSCGDIESNPDLTENELLVMFLSRQND